MLNAMALGRRTDQVIIDAMDAASLPAANTIAVDYGSSSGNTNLTAAKVARASALMQSYGIPREDRFMVISAFQEESLYFEDQFANSRFTSISPRLVDSGSIDNSNNFGMNFIVIPEMTEGGLPYSSGTIRECFAFHRRAMGLGDWSGFPHICRACCTSIVLSGSSDNVVGIYCD